MTDLRRPFPDVESAVMELLADLGTTDTVTTSTLADDLPFIRIMKLGGPATRLFDSPHMDVDCYHLSRDACQALADAVEVRLLSGSHVTSFGLIDSVSANSSPHRVPWTNPGIFRLTASYSLSARR